MPRRHMNPQFDPSPAEVASDWRRMLREPRTLVRPVLVLGGWRSPMLVSARLATRLKRLTTGRNGDITPVAYPLAGSVEGAAREVRRRIDELEATGPFDVVAISMGGLVARHMAAERQLDIARLFTLATPHRGADLARLVRPDRASAAMRAQSLLLRKLDDALPLATYELLCYAQLRDWWVGARNLAPADRHAVWIDGGNPAQLTLSHFTIASNRAIIADIARRLRAEEPLARGLSEIPRD